MIILNSVLLINVVIANGDINISTDTNWPEDDYSMDTLTVSNGATLSIDGGSTLSVTGTLHISENSKIVLKGKNTSGQVESQWQGTGVEINTANITIDTGSKIVADGQGYVGGGTESTGAGPGAGVGCSGWLVRGNGASYGGSGTLGGSCPGVGSIYGLDSVANPTDLGSGGGGGMGYGYGNVNYGWGGNGGGAIRLIVTNTLTLNGATPAMGADGQSGPVNLGPGGGGTGGWSSRSSAPCAGPPSRRPGGRS